MFKGFRLGRPAAARILGTCFALALLASSVTAQTPLGTSFTYQGRLTQSGAPASGPFDLEFRLFGVDTGGSDVAAPVVIEDVPVTSGLFAVTLDFGAAAFAGQKRWLEIGVRPGASTGAFTPLAGRQELTPTPNAVFSATAGDAATLGGIPSSGYRLTGGVLSIAEGGTGATTAAAARTNLQAAQSGANSDITAISGLTTALSVAQGGTGSTTADGARAALGAQEQLGVPDITTLAPNAGEPSAKLGSDGLVLIAYRDWGNGHLKVAHCSNAACTSATLSTVDSSTPLAPSLAIGADGLGLISYGSYSGNVALKVAHCADVACTSATTTTLDSSASQVGQYSSIAIGSDGFGLISYYDATNGNLKVAHCNNTACTSATLTTVDAANDTGQYSSVTTGADGLGLVSYFDATANLLKVAHCSNVACTGTATITALDDLAGMYSSITTGADGLGLISYQDLSLGALKVAHCSNATCSSATFSVLDDSPTQTGADTSITRGPDGLGVISYYHSNPGQDLMLVRCANAACTSAEVSVLASAGDVGREPSVVFGADGRFLVSYRDETSGGDLKVFHEGAGLGIAAGGTGATTAFAARANLQAAQRGANTDITSLTGLTTALGVNQGGTGSTTSDGARAALGAQEQLGVPAFTILDTVGGLYSSAKLGSDGLVLIAYEDIVNNDLKVAHCSNTQCTSATLSTLDSSNDIGATSLAIGADGLGVISYYAYGGTTWALKVARCANVACTSATTAIVDPSVVTASADDLTSIAIGTDNLGLISYYDNGDLMVAHCENTACTSAEISLIDSAGNAGRFSSLAIGADGLGLISYREAAQGLKVAHCSNVACTTAAKTTLDGSGGGSTSIMIGADGLGLISYQDVILADLKVAHCSNVTCSAATLSVADPNVGAPGTFRFTSLTPGPDGLGVISYYEGFDGDLKLARCQNATCTSSTLSVLDSVGDVGWYPSLVFGADGRFLVSYLDVTNVDLKVVREGAIVGIAAGGTGATDAAGARASLLAAQRGANGDITSLTGLTTALSVTQGGTGATNATNARTNLQAAKIGANSDITSLTGLTTALSLTQGGTGATDAASGRANLGAAASGANSDITQLTGLTGFRLATGAAVGHVLTADAAGNGTWQPKGGVTSVASGAGLTGGPITTTGTLAVNFTGSTGTAPSAARADHNHNTTYAPLAHNHDAAYASINHDHDAVYAPAAAPATALATLDAAAEGAAYTSATTGADGRGLISYADTATGLKVAHCADAACSSATVTTLMTGPVTYNSITIGSDGFGLISFYASDTQDLKLVHCTNTACSTFGAPTTLDSTGDVGWYNSITIGTDGFGLISYDDETSETLKVVHCTNTACSTFNTPTTLDATANVGEYISMTIGADGLGLISYFDNSGNDLKVAHCSNTACSSATSTTLDSTGDVGQFTSIAIGADGFGLISYYDVTNDDLKVAHCTNTACTAAGLDVVDSTGLVGKYGSLAIGADGLGLISYHDETNGDLKVAHCTSIACTSTTRATLASSATNVLGTFTSVAIGGDALGLISYADTTTGDLKVAHCQNLLCSPFVVRRR